MPCGLHGAISGILAGGILCFLQDLIFLLRTLHNSFDGTNTVLRPGESQEGEGRKKKLLEVLGRPLPMAPVL